MRTKGITRRDFLKSSALVGAAAMTRVSLAESANRSATATRLLTGWEYHHGSLGGAWEIWKGQSGDDASWQVVSLPHCFNARDAVDPDEHYYQGPGWYRTRLKVSNPFPNGRTLLHFEGSGQKTTVFVGLDKVGDHIGGYDEFVVDVSDAAAKALRDPDSKGEVPVAILCNNSRDLELIPSNFSDFNLYGGIYRYLNLVYVPAVSLERVHITPTVQPSRPTTISVKARLYNPAAQTGNLQISIRTLDPKGSVVHSASQKLSPWTGERELLVHEINSPQLWSPKNPNLYRCEVTLTTADGEMKVTERFGLHYTEWVTHGPFKLNGERLLIRGTQRHEDHAGLGSAMTEDLIRKEMQMIKDVGANFVRLAHYQQSRIVLDLCDELGIFVWEEIPWCRSGIGGEQFHRQTYQMLRNMIDQHYNHPAVLIWGLGNEDDWPGEYPELDQQKIRAFLTELRDMAHTLDPTRVTGIRRCDFCKDIPDIYSPSIWAGWYRGRYTEYKGSSEEEMKKVNHFIHMEWGGDSHARRHSEDPDKVLSKIATGQGTDERGLDYLLTGGQARASRDGDWSETYICNLFDWHLKEQETMPWLTGTAQWIFKDFSTPDRPENPVPRVNQKGLVERDFTPKEGYYVFQSYWTDKPMVRIYGHSWPVRWGDEGEQKMVKVYSNCDTAELFLNDTSCGVKKRDSQNFPAAGLRWMVAFKKGENHLRVTAQKIGTTLTDEVRFVYQTEKWDKPAQLQLKELARNGDTVTVEARLLDTNGLTCLDSRARVRFELSGDGTFLDHLGTSTGSSVVELYNGRAEISVLRNNGKSSVSVSSKGVSTALFSIS